MLGELVLALVADMVRRRTEVKGTLLQIHSFYAKDRASLYLSALTLAAAEMRGGVVDGDGWPPS